MTLVRKRDTNVIYCSMVEVTLAERVLLKYG